MNQRIYFFLFIIISLGCSKIPQDQIIGSWWSNEVDSTYSESYINEDEWVYNHESFGPISYKYTIDSDSIIIGMKKWAVYKASDTSLVLYNQDEKLLLYKLFLKESLFVARKDSLAYENFQEEFTKRYLMKSEERK